jgi:hypothetical protein
MLMPLRRSFPSNIAIGKYLPLSYRAKVAGFPSGPLKRIWPAFSASRP